MDGKIRNLVRRFVEHSLSLRNAALAAVLLSAGITGCAAPEWDPADPVGKQGMIYAINAALTDGDCTSAIILAEKLYDSPSVDDEVRRLRASAHGCRAGINFFKLIGDLGSADYTPGAGGLPIWRVLTLLFPSSASDGKAESAFYATDSLQTWLTPGVVPMAPFRIDVNAYNVGSVRASDHGLEANIYLLLTSMASIGTIQNRYGNPNAAGERGQAFSWTSLAALDETGCGYVSSLLNLVDAMNAVSSSVPLLSSVATQVATASAGFDAACSAACTACGGGISCSACPSNLRHRSACARTTPATATAEACSAVGLVQLMNGVAGWQQ